MRLLEGPTPGGADRTTGGAVPMLDPVSRLQVGPNGFLTAS